LGTRDACQVEELSHLGYLLKAGDVCVGYDLRDTQLVDDEAETQRSQGKLPDVIVVRKLYGGAAVTATAPSGDDAASSAAKQRIWKLQRLDVDAASTAEIGRRGAAKARDDDMDVDEEDFMQEVEADREMRQNINLYRSGPTKKQPSTTAGDDEHENAEEDDHDDDQQVKLDELLDGLALDAGPDEDLVDAPQPDGGDGGQVEFEEGKRALKDGISYVDREAGRAVRGKEVAIHVPSLGDGFLQNDKKK
jgi:nonsense-mediated mRNA decay protein 3